MFLLISCSNLFQLDTEAFHWQISNFILNPFLRITYCFIINASKDIGDSNYSSDSSVYQNIACLTLFYTSLIPEYSKRNAYYLVTSCKT